MDHITRNLVRSLLPPRDPLGHKGTFGKVYIWGGCVGYTGAPVYAGEAAVRTGSGLVHVGVPEEIYPIAAARCAASMAHPVPGTYEGLLEEAMMARVLPRPEIVTCHFGSEANQVGAFYSYLNAGKG